MPTSIELLKHLVRESRYAIDERAVADAILTRARKPVNADRAGRDTLTSALRVCRRTDGAAQE